MLNYSFLMLLNNLHINVFNLMSRTNEAMNLSWHETCRFNCRLDVSVCNNKQRWNNDNCRCECKEQIEKGKCDDGFIWNSSICKCECDKSCDVAEYLDYASCEYRKRMIDELVEECSEDTNGNEMIHNVNLNDHKKVCNSCTIYMVLLIITFIKIK